MDIHRLEYYSAIKKACTTANVTTYIYYKITGLKDSKPQVLHIILF